MSNQQTVIMVPAKAKKQDLITDTNVIVYMPLATTKNPGVVKIGEGLNIDVDGLLTFDKNEVTISQIAKNGEIIYPDENKIVNIQLSKNDVGLNNVDNTSDIHKPVSIYQQNALNNKLNKYAGVSNRNKFLQVGFDGYITYTPIKMFEIINDGTIISNDAESFNFTSLFAVTSSDSKKITIDGSSKLKDALRNVSYNANDGILSFERVNGTTLNIDLPLELIIKSGYYDDETSELVLVLANEEEIRIPVAQLVNDYYADNETLELVTVDDKLTFKIKDLGITTSKIANGAVTDSKIHNISGFKVTGSVSKAILATSDEHGNNIFNTYQKIIDSYSKTEIESLLSDKANTSQLPRIQRLGGF